MHVLSLSGFERMMREIRRSGQGYCATSLVSPCPSASLNKPRFGGRFGMGWFYLCNERCN